MAAKFGTSAVVAASLPDLYDLDEFTATYRACLAGQPMVIRNERQAPKTKFKGLIDLYLKSSEWQA
jgi:hypothetical protein